MDLQNFEEYIDDKILHRGRDYFMSGSIFSLEYIDDEWVADVEGTDNYTVTVNLSKDGEITDTSCDCPYEFGEYCKHQVAVFLALRGMWKQGTIEKSAKVAAKKERLDDILEKLDKQTLTQIILHYTKIYKPMKSEIEFRYAKKKDVADSARKVIRAAINAVKRRGYVEYDDTASATDGADAVLRMMEDEIDSNNLLTAVLLGIIVVEEMMDLMDYCDDSNGYVGGAISEAVGKMRDAVEVMPENYEHAQKLFDTILAHALSNIYRGWTEWRISLFYALVPLCCEQDNRNRLETAIFSGISQNPENRRDDYYFRNIQRLQLDIISHFDGEAAAQRYIEQNLDNIDFHRIAINNALEAKQYEQAISLCIEGEKTNEKYPGIVKDLMQLRYKAYESMGDTDNQKTLALTLLLDGDFDYFIECKKLHSTDEWQSAIQEIYTRTEDKWWGIYEKIIVHENHKPRILVFCENRSEAITRYYTHLLPEYTNEVERVFESYIRNQAAAANSRNNYIDVCEIIKICNKACPDVAVAMRKEIAEKYARRPAFMDELRKI